MGGQQTEEPLGTTEMGEDNGSTGTRLWQSHGANGARSEHGALVCREYN